jgi:hypothetical protein|tara:strand:- start:3937 stop:4461 length:525 start_codon:yes stop_codon:yes gene_type:complete
MEYLIMFDVMEYANNLVVSQDDEELQQALKVSEINNMLCDDGWLVRQLYFGVAGAMERQIQYLGGTLIPNAESRVTKMSSDGVRGESLVVDSWFGTSNADDSHNNDETPTQQLDDTLTFIEGLHVRMRTAAIIMVVNIKAHDSVSKDLEQMGYFQIKARAAQSRDSKAPKRKAA